MKLKELIKWGSIAESDIELTFDILIVISFVLGYLIGGLLS